ncbi:ABC transporter substrate-binding protein [Antrihabitans sp. YC3-6]|uniref:ABC transporter substrate-binding protein n=1 Tax=Antrihabitans stalagmiti TaxID=2799499 RepID=A0A934NT47_9NOCA|nr:ABC transporter substrate-binding protein [Antrihabitans stalagmiti]MBJ8341053.1 ABC transporter substrate-binding protein [Antrihabitans stalagmiti]
MTTTITLYTSEPPHKIDRTIEAFTKHNPGIKVQLFRAPTGELKSKIEAEALAGQIKADVLLAADAPTFERYKQQGRLLKYRPADARLLHRDLVDPDGYYVATRIIPTVICYNTNAGVLAPRSWKALAETRFFNRIAIASPRISAASAHNTTIWRTTPRLGRPWLEALSANQPRVAYSNSWVGELVGAGLCEVGIVTDHVARELVAKGAPIGISYPSEGSPFVTQPVAIIATTRVADAAKLFVNFLLSQEGQQIAAEQHYLPVRPDVQPLKGFPGIKLLPPNPLPNMTIRIDRREHALAS